MRAQGKTTGTEATRLTMARMSGGISRDHEPYGNENAQNTIEAHMTKASWINRAKSQETYGTKMHKIQHGRLQKATIKDRELSDLD